MWDILYVYTPVSVSFVYLTSCPVVCLLTCLLCLSVQVASFYVWQLTETFVMCAPSATKNDNDIGWMNEQKIESYAGAFINAK